MEGGEKQKEVWKTQVIQSVIRTRAPERLAWRRLHAVSGHRDADELVQDAFGDSRTGESWGRFPEGGKEGEKEGRRAERQVLHFQLFRVEWTQDESILFFKWFILLLLSIYLLTRTTWGVTWNSATCSNSHRHDTTSCSKESRLKFMLGSAPLDHKIKKC